MDQKGEEARDRGSNEEASIDIQDLGAGEDREREKGKRERREKVSEWQKGQLERGVLAGANLR